MLLVSGTYLYQPGHYILKIIKSHFSQFFLNFTHTFLDHQFQQAMEKIRNRPLVPKQSIAIITRLIQNQLQQPMNIKLMRNHPHQFMSLKYSAKQNYLMLLLMLMLKVLTMIIIIKILVRMLSCPLINQYNQSRTLPHHSQNSPGPTLQILSSQHPT